MSNNESNVKKKPKQAAILLGEELYERVHAEADNQNKSMSALGREAYQYYLDAGINGPNEMLQLVDLSEKIKNLQGTIPEEEYNSIQKTLSNIMKIKGGLD